MNIENVFKFFWAFIILGVIAWIMRLRRQARLGKNVLIQKEYEDEKKKIERVDKDKSLRELVDEFNKRFRSGSKPGDNP